MMKKVIKCLIVWIGVSIAFFAANGAAKRPNVLFISVDDLNDWVGCIGGNPQAKTPNLDKFNSEGGMVMYDAHCAAPLCGPSRGALLTGRYPHKTGIYQNQDHLPTIVKKKNLITLPEYFSQHGYHTISRGKIFHPQSPIPKDNKWNFGKWAFDEWAGRPSSVAPIGSKRPVNGLPNLPNEKKSYHSKAFDWGPTKGNDETKMRDHVTASWGAKQLEKRDFDKPFFMAIGISQPHLPWHLPQKYFDMHPLEDIVLPKTLKGDLKDIKDKKGKFLKPDPTWQRVENAGRHKEAVQAYLAAVSFADECVGLLLDSLAQSKYADNTIVVIWGDHGWHLGEKLKYGKATLWQESCRTTLMVKVPGLTPNNKKCMGVVNLIDLYPTLLDLCGLPKNSNNDGRSLVKLLKSPDMTWNEPTLTDFYHFGAHRIYDGRYSYIVFEGKGTEELYDHKKDPMEWKNLVAHPEYAQIYKRLKALVPTEREPDSRKNK
ncbi:MAG: sulfatase [Planctomycetes bacterium]|nr:sulfatase [Planctomycetota bacterium]